MSISLPSIYLNKLKDLFAPKDHTHTALENRVEILERVVNRIDYVEFSGTDIDITKYCTAWSSGGTAKGTATCSFEVYHLGKIEATINFSAGFTGASSNPNSHSFTIPFSAIGKYGNDDANEDKPALSGVATVTSQVTFTVSQNGTKIVLSRGGNNWTGDVRSGVIIFQGYWK